MVERGGTFPPPKKINTLSIFKPFSDTKVTLILVKKKWPTHLLMWLFPKHRDLFHDICSELRKFCHPFLLPCIRKQANVSNHEIHAQSGDLFWGWGGGAGVHKISKASIVCISIPFWRIPTCKVPQVHKTWPFGWPVGRDGWTDGRMREIIFNQKKKVAKSSRQ
jgi:hypothetical protein